MRRTQHSRGFQENAQFFYDSGLGIALHLRKCQRKICNGNDLNINGVYLGTFVKKMRTFRFLTEAGAWSKQIGCC